MKKYLMMGVAALALASCSHDDIQFAQPPVNPNPTKAEQYQTAFVSTFGVPAATQTWGFNQGGVMSAPGRRSAQPNSNQWGTTDDNSKYLDYPKPADITPEEREAVLAVFSQPGKEHYEPLVNWSRFFVQQVYCGPEGYKMTQLACKDPNGHEETQYLWSAERGNYTITTTSYLDEVNNFNEGKYSGNAEQGCMLMWYSSTTDWSYKSTQGGGQRFHYFRMEKINGNYYVGLDFASERQASANANEEFDRDLIYNDWIVKIVPGKGESVPVDEVIEEGMIICEDLGNIGDFDFNDAVFYAKIWSNGTTEITLLAAGGTLELSVAGKEVHEALLGAENAKKGDVYKMINTGADATAKPYTFEVTGYTRLIDIPVVVKQKGAAGDVTSYELSAQRGMAPQKICVPKGFKWCKERKSLAETYSGFKAWTTGAASTWAGEYKAEDVYETKAE